MTTYTCFKCPYIGLDFDTDSNGPRHPYVGLKGNKMVIAIRSTLDTVKAPAHWLVDLLSQPVYKNDGFTYALQGTPKLPQCPGCQRFFMKISPRMPHFLMCGHLICEGCMASNNEKRCRTCHAFYGNDENPKCTILTKFYEQLMREQPGAIASLFAKEATRKMEEKQSKQRVIEEDRRKRALEETRRKKETEEAAEIRKASLKPCAACNISASISLLIHCSDCAVSICGGCFVKGHQGHKIVSLVEIELANLQKKESPGIIGTIEDYRKNFRGLHSATDEDIAELAKLVGDKFDKLTSQDSYENGMATVERMRKLKTDFEQKCEAYMPIVRKFNDELIDLREQIEQRKQEAKPETC